jgi:hypothetical protein
MRILLTLIATVLSFGFTAVVAFFASLLLAGPHGGILPAALQPVVLIIAWLAITAVPIAVARWAWRRFAPPPS